MQQPEHDDVTTVRVSHIIPLFVVSHSQLKVEVFEELHACVIHSHIVCFLN